MLVAFKIANVDISCIITCDSDPYCSNFITCIRIYDAKKKVFADWAQQYKAFYVPNQETASARILEESVPRGSFARTWKLSSRLFSQTDWLPLDLRGWITVNRQKVLVLGRKGWRSAHLPPVWPGFTSRLRRPMWVEFVCFLLCSKRFFCRYSSFPLSSKTNIFKSNSTRNQVDKEPLCGCATSKSLFIYVFIIQNLTVTHQNW